MFPEETAPSPSSVVYDRYRPKAFSSVSITTGWHNSGGGDGKVGLHVCKTGEGTRGCLTGGAVCGKAVGSDGT